MGPPGPAGPQGIQGPPGEGSSTPVDLSNYATKEELSNGLGGKANASTVGGLSTKVNSIDARVDAIEEALSPPDSYSLYRLTISSNNGNVDYTTLGSLELRELVGGPNIATIANGGTVGGTGTVADHGPALAFDGDSNTYWSSEGRTGTLTYQFPQRVVLREYALVMPPGPGQLRVDQSPAAWKLEGSNNGGDTWVAIGQMYNQVIYDGGVLALPLEVASETEYATAGDVAALAAQVAALTAQLANQAPRLLPEGWQNYPDGTTLTVQGGTLVWRNPDGTAPPRTAYQHYRLHVIENSGATDFINVAELALRAVPGGPNIATGGTAYSNSDYGGYFSASTAFDNDPGTFWSTSDGIAADVNLDYTLSAPQAIVEYAITGPPGAHRTQRPPKTWRLGGSNDGVTWTELHAVTDVGVWSEGETKTFTIP